MEHRVDDNMTDEKKASKFKSTHLSERLKKERSKALEILLAKGDKSGKECNYRFNKATNQYATSKTLQTNKENACEKSKHPDVTTIESKSLGVVTKTKPKVGTLKSMENSTKTASDLTNCKNNTNLDNQPTTTLSDHVPDHRPREVINISDLITNDTISLEMSTFSSLKSTEVSFHPAEMTGRSTTHHGESKQRKPIKYSVDQILASSIVENIHELRNSNKNSNGSILSSNRLSSAASSRISGFSAMQKNPRLTQMSSFESKSSLPCKSDFPFQENQMNTNNCSEDEHFAPAELQRSQLLKDEISWALERAALPTAVLSEEARKKLTMCSADDVSEHSISNSISFNDTNFSVGGFFAKRSDNIANIIQNDRPKRDHHEPVALISDNTITVTAADDSLEKYLQIYNVLTPTIDNNEVDSGNALTLNTNKHTSIIPEKHDSKDSGNATEKSDVSRSSDINRILYNLDLAASSISNNESGKTNSVQEPHISAINKANADADLKLNKGNINMKEITDIIMENKENIQLYEKCSNDTLSFTESLLNTSIQNYRISNAGQARSPLSPIPITAAESLDTEADIDEFPSSPIVNPMRRKRFSKSPNSSQSIPILSDTAAISETVAKQLNELQQRPQIRSVQTFNNSNTKASPPVAQQTVVKSKKSFCSTRLDSDQISPIVSHTDISSNNLKPSCTRAHTPTTYNGVNTYELSPLSSPCSYFSSLAPSPQWEKEKNFNTQYHLAPANVCNKDGCLAAGNLRRVVSSPSQSETSTTTTIENKCNNVSTSHGGVPPMRTYSSCSVKSCDGTSSTRASSRCSNNSEFSHRDGKIIPIKVTAFELSWASVELHTDSKKSLQVKNTSDKRLKVRIEINGPGFKLINPDGNLLTLQSQECLTIYVNFSPTMTGPAIGTLKFQAPTTIVNGNNIHNNHNNACTTNNEITIPLYAYGGQAITTIQKLTKGPVGPHFLPMGEFCTLMRPLERTFQIYNQGSLSGFAAIYVEPIKLHLSEISKSLKVYPECTLIPSRSAVTIHLTLELNHNDIRKIRKITDEVMTLAKLRIIYGDEATRQRLRQIQRSTIAKERDNLFARSLDKLWEKFPGEKIMFPSGLFKDTASSVSHDMWACISEKEVALTLNNTMLPADTAADFSTIFTEADSTVLFRTFCMSPPPTNLNPQLETVDETVEATHTHLLSATTSQNNSPKSTSLTHITISPEFVELKMEKFDDNQPKLTIQPAILCVRNYSNMREYFNIVCNQKNLFRFVPHEGHIEANGVELPIEMKLCSEATMKDIPSNVAIIFHMDNNKITIPVHMPSHHSNMNS